MRLATWNINSIRARHDRVLAWLRRSNIDVLAFQETKIDDARFPVASLANLGYRVAHHGTNQWNGVAIASRIGLDDVQVGVPGLPSFGDDTVAEARSIGAICGGVRVWSLYVPNGRAVDDPHYHYKLHWLAVLRDYAEKQLANEPHLQMALCGDFNIAPTDDDIWSVEYYQGSTHVTGPERQAFANLVDTGFTDVVRPFHPGPGVFTYWDYTRLSFQKRRGMRIDFALASPALAARVTGAEIDREERKGKGSSDHAPVVVALRDQ